MQGFFGGFVCLFVFWSFRAMPAAYGGSQARGQIRAIPAGLHHSHSNVRSEPTLRLTPQLTRILNPLSKARDGTHVLMDTSWIRLHGRNFPVRFLTR